MYTMPRAGRALGIGAVVLTFAFLECADFVEPFAPVVTNEVDNFDFQVPLTGVTTTARYTWETTGSAANVNLSSAVTAGTATVTISDADAALIFTHALDGSGVTSTGSGTAGNWVIVVALSNTRGTVHFTVQKP